MEGVTAGWTAGFPPEVKRVNRVMDSPVLVGHPCSPCPSCCHFLNYTICSYERCSRVGWTSSSFQDTTRSADFTLHTSSESFRTFIRPFNKSNRISSRREKDCEKTCRFGCRV